MSISEFIISYRPISRPDHDDDIHTLLARNGMESFPYRNVTQHEQVATSLSRWPLLNELSGLRREPGI